MSTIGIGLCGIEKKKGMNCDLTSWFFSRASIFEDDYIEVAHVPRVLMFLSYYKDNDKYRRQLGFGGIGYETSMYD